MSSNVPQHISNDQVYHNVVNNDYSLFYTGRAYSKRIQNRSTRPRRSSISTSSALALLAFLFFLNMLQRSLDDNKQQGPMVMTRTTTIHPIIPRKNVAKNKQSTITNTTRNNILVTTFENIFNKYLK